MKINKELLKKYEDLYNSDKKNKVIENAISNVGIKDASLSRNVVNEHDFIFSKEIDTKEVTNQKKTGRCWMFAALNMARPKMIKDLNVENFEFSETYLYFYDNLEKCNRFLQRIIETKDSDLEDRDVMDALLQRPDDGGYFQFFTALIDKYGIVPKEAMKDTYHTEQSMVMFDAIERVVRKAAYDIRNKENESKIEEIRDVALSKCFNILKKSIGTPTTTFDFKYYDKDDKFHVDYNLTPHSFYEKYLKDFFKDMVVLLNDPRKEYDRVLVQKHVKNVVEMPDMEGINVDMETMKEALIKSVDSDVPSWFACDVMINMEREMGIFDNNLYNYDLTLVPVENFSKIQRIESYYSYPCHAMAVIGYDKKDDTILKWKVENSWGEDNGKKGYYSMSDDWFKEHTYEVVVDKKHIEELYKRAYSKDKIELSKYEPLSRKVK